MEPIGTPMYDPMDPLLFEDAHSTLPLEIEGLVQEKKAVPVLVSQAAIYPHGRIMPVVMKESIQIKIF